jgi:Cu/Ag efflux pump CusA
MAIIIIGGLITSTVLNLVVTPALYLRYGSSPEPEAVESMVIPVPTGGTD